MRAHLSNHHMAVKGATAVLLGRSVDKPANLGHDGGAKGHVGHKVAIPTRKKRGAVSRVEAVDRARFHDADMMSM